MQLLAKTRATFIKAQPVAYNEVLISYSFSLFGTFYLINQNY